MVDTKKTDKSVLDGINIDELIETTKMEILPDYAKEILKPHDLFTSRKVIIDSLPTWKEIDTPKWKGTRRFMTILDNSRKYQVAIDSKSFLRSLVALDIKINDVKQKSDIDLSRLIGLEVGIKRIEFTNKDGLINEALNFYILLD